LHLHFSPAHSLPQWESGTGAVVKSAIRNGNLGSIRVCCMTAARLDAADPALPASVLRRGTTRHEVGLTNSRPVVPGLETIFVEVALLVGTEKPRHLVGPAAGGVLLIETAEVMLYTTERSTCRHPPDTQKN
jgi:hypothetical protein